MARELRETLKRDPTAEEVSQALKKITILNKVQGILNRVSSRTYHDMVGHLRALLVDVRAEEQAQLLHDIAEKIHRHSLTTKSHRELYAGICAAFHDKEQEQRYIAGGGHEAVQPVAFRRALLNACQEFFQNPPSLPEDCKDCETEGEGSHTQKCAPCSEEELKLKDRKLANIELMAELFREKLMHRKIVHAIIQKLLHFGPNKGARMPSNDNLPSYMEVSMLCTLLECVAPSFPEKKELSLYFSMLKKMVPVYKDPKTKFKIQGLLDFRDRGWQKSSPKGREYFKSLNGAAA